MFKPFPKIARLHREVIVTEKIDGMCAQIHILNITTCDPEDLPGEEFRIAEVGQRKTNDTFEVYCGLRNDYVELGNGHARGFTEWVRDNAVDLVKHLGPGRHHGEWWGQGIGRGYDLGTNKFSLFNVSRWVTNWRHGTRAPLGAGQQYAPMCCDVVPIIKRGLGMQNQALLAEIALKDSGSLAAPGFNRPEGYIVYHTAGDVCFKRTFDKNDQAKGAV